MINFKIPGTVKGKARPRVSTFNGFARAYNTKETIDYENYVKMCYLNEKDQDTYFNGEALECCIMVYCAIPKSTSKKKSMEMLAGNVRPTKKPDCDNIAKIILDALNKIAYTDDTQIVDLTVRKFYSEEEYVKVWISPTIKSDELPF